MNSTPACDHVRLEGAWAIADVLKHNTTLLSLKIEGELLYPSNWHVLIVMLMAQKSSLATTAALFWLRV